MPFLARNPNATRRSILAWAIGGAVFGGVSAFLLFGSNQDSQFRFWVIPLKAAIGAAVGALVEWGWNDEEDDPPAEPQNTP
jgi:hypothetical protein